jgi:putative membrane protein
VSPSGAFAWNWDPAVLLGLLALCYAYYGVVGPLRERRGWGEPPSRRQITSFVVGMLLLALCLISPLDALGRTTLFSAHMLQLMVINTVVGPLLLLGLPAGIVRTSLGPLRNLGEYGLIVVMLAAAGLFNAVFLLWHAGSFYEPALHNEALRDLEILTILLTGILRWWPVLTPDQPKLRLASPTQILYILLESLPIDIFGVALIFALRPTYATYALATPVWHLTASLDQTIAGCIALIPGTFLDFILISIVFFAWLRRVEHDQEREDERLAALPRP